MSEFPVEAGFRLERILHWAATNEGSLRTHLDEWAAFEFGGELLTSGMRQRWFNNPCALTHGARLLQHMDAHSPQAKEICERGVRSDNAVKKPKAGEPAPYRLMVDHSIPVKVLGIAIKCNADLRDLQTLRDFLHANFCRTVITKAEDRLLNLPFAKEQKSLRQRMPSDWRFGDDTYARYHAVGIEVVKRR